MYYYIIIAGLCSKQEDDERAIAEIRKECEALRVEKGDKFTIQFKYMYSFILIPVKLGVL